jgi:hypothetical protein
MAFLCFMIFGVATVFAWGFMTHDFDGLFGIDIMVCKEESLYLSGIKGAFSCCKFCVFMSVLTCDSTSLMSKSSQYAAALSQVERGRSSLHFDNRRYPPPLPSHLIPPPLPSSSFPCSSISSQSHTGPPSSKQLLLFQPTYLYESQVNSSSYPPKALTTATPPTTTPSFVSRVLFVIPPGTLYPNPPSTLFLSPLYPLSTPTLPPKFQRNPTEPILHQDFTKHLHVDSILRQNSVENIHLSFALRRAPFRILRHFHRLLGPKRRFLQPPCQWWV